MLKWVCKVARCWYSPKSPISSFSGTGKIVQFTQAYSRNPTERRTMEELLAAISGGRGGRGGRGRRKGGKRGVKHDLAIPLGKSTSAVRWPALSFTLGKTQYGSDWLHKRELDVCKVQDEDKDNFQQVQIRDLEGGRTTKRKVSEMNWSTRGWSGRQMRGRYVGCPESTDGTPLKDFRSIVIELKRVANQTKAGKKRTSSALVVIGNGNGAAGFAIGKGEETKAAIRKAKNKAINYLQYIPRCDDHTIYHNIKVKYCRTTILMERRVRGAGIHCQRAIGAICNLAGIKDMRAKILGSTNPLNIVRATFTGLTQQESHVDLAKRTGLFVVEYRRECHYRPTIVAIPVGTSMLNSSAFYPVA